MTYEKIIDKTPSGGDYSEIFYLDDKGNSTDSDKATHCIIRSLRMTMKVLFHIVPQF